VDQLPPGPTAAGPPRDRPGWHGPLRFVAFTLAALAFSALFRLHSPTVPDPDSFYHFRHAALYAQKGLWMREFPWLAYSTVSRFAADLGYGFHVLLIPFTFLKDQVLGLKLATAFELAILLVLLYVVMRRHRVAYDFAWPFMVPLSSPPIMYGCLMTRPHIITMGLSALLLSFLVPRISHRGNARVVTASWWGVFLTSAALTFVHANFFWLIPALVAVVGAVRLLTERRWEWRSGAAALLGMCVGWLLRPNPLGAVQIEYVQLIVHTAERRKGILPFGREWLPLPPDQAASQFLWFILLWLALAVIFIWAAARRRGELLPEDRTLLWSSLPLSLAFFALTIFDTKRFIVLWVAFAVVFMAGAFSRLVGPAQARPDSLLTRDTRLMLAVCLGLLYLMMAKDGVEQHLVKPMWLGIPPYRMQEAGVWLKDHSRPGDIVFNVGWDLFPELFFWDTQNRYVSGLDPIFLYAYDQRLYWEDYHLEAGAASQWTYPTLAPNEAAREETYTALQRDFRARYVVLQPPRSPALYAYLDSDRRFVSRFRSSDVAVFEVRSPHERSAVASRGSKRATIPHGQTEAGSARP